MKTKPPKFTKKKIIGLISAVLAIALLLVLTLGSCGGGDIQVSAEYEPYTVERGDITVSVTGSGTVEPIEQYEIQSIVTGDILEDYVTLGAEVKKDDILYVIDSSSARNSIERSQVSYEQQVISYNNKLRDYNEAQANRSVTSPITGVITEMYVKNGDEINAGTKICEIKNTGSLTVRVPFLSGNAKNIYKNQDAKVYFDDRNEQIAGYVSHVATGTYTTEAGAIVSDIEITFKNPGAIRAGEVVTATVGGFACNDFGMVEEADLEVITSKVAGDVEGLNYSKGDSIIEGSLILKIADDFASSDMRSNELSLKNARLSLDDQIDRLDDYTITSPISGTVISKTMKEGDTLDGNKSSLAIVADMSKLTFEISVDELYIQNIEVGQTVSVTADALPDKTFEGVVDTVSIIGTATSGVTVYPVTVVISEYEGLLPGMNVDAEIVISNAKDVLMVPVNAISRGNLVLVSQSSSITGLDMNAFKKQESAKPADGMAPPEGIKPPEGTTSFVENPDGADKEYTTKRADGANKKNNKSEVRLPNAPDGYKYIMVETGVANDDYVEVKAGLSEGDEICVMVIRNTSTEENALFGRHNAMTGGSMPIGGGRMPSGSMPSGGMPSGGMPSGGMGGMR